MEKDEFGFPILQEENTQGSGFDEFGFPSEPEVDAGFDEFGFPVLSADTLGPPEAANDDTSPNNVNPPIDPTQAYSVPFAGMGDYNPYESEYQAIQDAQLAEDEKKRLAIQAERDALKNEIVLEQMQQPPQVELPPVGGEFTGGPQDFSTAFQYGDLTTRGNIQNLLADTEEALSGTGLMRGLQTVQNKSLPIVNAVREFVGAKPLPEDANLRASILKELELERSGAAYLKAAEELGFKPKRVGEIENLRDFFNWASTTLGASGSPMLVTMATSGLISPVVLGSELDANLREIEGLSKEDRLKLAYTGGVIAGLMENLGIGILIKGIPDELVGKIGLQGMADIAQKTYGGRVGQQVLQTAAAEGLIEVAQEGTFVGIEAGAGKEFKEGEIKERLTEAVAGGATIGGFFGGTRGAVTETSDATTKEDKKFIKDIEKAGNNAQQVAIQNLATPQVDIEQPISPSVDDSSLPSATTEQTVNVPPEPEKVEQPSVPSSKVNTPEPPTKPDVAYATVLTGAMTNYGQMEAQAFNSMLKELNRTYPGIEDDVRQRLNLQPEAPKTEAQPTIPAQPTPVPKVETPTQPEAPKADPAPEPVAPITRVKTRDAITSKLDELNATAFNDVLREEVYPNLFGVYGGLVSEKRMPEVIERISEEEQIFTRTDAEAVKLQKEIIANLDEVTADNERSGGEEYAPLTAALREYKEYLKNVEVVEPNPQRTETEIGTDTDGEVKSVQTPDGQKNYNVKGKIVELSDLKQAQGQLQPRDRSRKDSDVLAKKRANPAEFNPARLLDDPTSGSGGPIIARDGTIISGNGRVLTLQEVYTNQKDSLKAYKDSLQSAGLNIEGFKQPVFVRQLTDDMTFDQLREFADLSNTEAQAQMSMTERASRDATRLTESGIIDLFRGDFDIGSTQNREFVSEYAKKVLSPTEQGAFVRSDGSPSAEGLNRIRNAILASAFDDADTLAIMLESTDDNIKAIGNAFMATAPKFAQLKKQVADGRTDAQFDITPQLAEMANLISRLRSEGVKPKDFYNQDSMFDVPNPEVKELVRAFYNEDLTKPNSMKAMKEFMDFYVNEALQKETGGLIADDTTAQDIIEQGRRKTEDKRSGTKQNQQGLFEATSDVESANARSEQVQKRSDQKRSQKTEKDERGKIEADEVGTTSDVNEVNTMTPGTVFNQVSQTTRQSIYRDAFADTGMSVDVIENKSTEQKFAILARTVSKKFGIASITAPEEGAGYTQVNQLLDAYHNLQWMTHSLAMPNTFIGLEGQLKLELPDQVTRFLGAFYPNANTIVMPQRSNSFAHEFGHALDYYLMDRYGDPEQMGKDTRGLSGLVRATQKANTKPWLDSAPQNVEVAFGNVINALFLDNADLSLKIMSLEQQIAKAEAFEAKTGRKTKKLPKLREQLRKLREGSGRSKVKPSEYKKTSATYGARENKVDYYLRPTEMFARAFEAYIAQKVEAAGGRNEFITKGDDAYKLAADQVKGADIRLAETFPKDHERHNIMLTMDQLFDALRAEKIAEGVAADAPGDTDMIDMRNVFWTTQAYEERTSLREMPKQIVQNIIRDQKRASQIAANKAQALKMRPNQFTGDTAIERKFNEFRDTYATNFLWTKRQILLTLSDRYAVKKDKKGKVISGNATVRRIMEDIISKVATDPGTRQDRVTAEGGTFEEAVRIESRRFYATFNRIATEFNMDTLTAAEQKELRLLLTGDDTTTSKASPNMVKLAAKLRRELLNPIYDYMVKNGQDINYVQDVGYMPRMLDAVLAISEVTEFLGELDGSKGAIPLYQQVIFDNEYGEFMEGDVEQMNALVKLALSDPDSSIGQEIASKYPELVEIATQMKETLKEINEINEILDNDTGDADVDGLEATIEELSASLNDLHGELHLELRNPYAIAAGKDWHKRIAIREGTDPSTNGVQGSFAKKRKLPPEADRYMNDFYLNPMEALMQYIPSAVRATEYNTRFGRDLVPEGSKKKGERLIDYLEYQLDQAQLAGMKTHEAQEVKSIVDMVTGRYPGPDNFLAKGMNTFNAYGTMALLPRAVLSSVAEPITAAVQTGSVVKGIQNLGLAFDGLGASLKGKKAVERKMYYAQLANVLGVVDLPLTGDMMNNRISGTAAEDSKNAFMLATFFLRTGLTNITIAQRKASMRIGLQFLIEQSAQFRNQEISAAAREEARQTLQDFGIRPEQMDAFTEFAQNLDKTENGLYEIDQIMDVDGSLTEMGRILALATNRFVDQTIQDPKIVDRPKWAERPMGRIIFGIQSFIAAFQRNVLEMSIKRAARDFKTQGKITGTKRLWTKMLLPLTSLYMGHTLSSMAREFVFNRDKWEEEKEDGQIVPWKYLAQLGISRSGFLGRADPWVNGIYSIKYQADLSNTLVGSSAAYVLKGVQRMFGLFQGNSEKTVSREYQFARGLYDLTVPFIAGRLATIPGVSHTFGYGLGAADMYVTSPTFKHFVLRNVIKQMYDVEYRPTGGGRQSSGSSGGWGSGGGSSGWGSGGGSSGWGN
jgi:uncharacterized membrane protein YgcG